MFWNEIIYKIIRKEAQTMPKRKLILDCDPGHDDAVAIMLAGNHPDIDLLGITVSTVNQTLEKTGKNALNITNYLGIDVPVALGSDRPIVRPLQIASDIHGETGLDGFDFPVHTKTYHDLHAVEFIKDILLASKNPVTIVTTGPMTNLALAILMHPSIMERIEEVVLMGGAYGYGNVSPAAEFNILVDPEAANIVFTSPLKVTMIGLDITRQVMVLPDIVRRMEKLDTKASDLFVKLMDVFNENQRKVFGLPGGPLHDPVTIAYLIDPALLKTKHVNCAIDLSQGISHGRTNCDMFDYLKLKRNTHVANAIDVDKFWSIVEDGLSATNK
jgi:ribosylpyrimidine nucleosidase